MGRIRMHSTDIHLDSRAGAVEVLSRCQTLAAFSEDSGGIRRTFLCPQMHQCHQAIRSWLEPLDALMRVDAVGNLRAVYPGQTPGGPRLLIGSHLDSVPNAGAYDGILGVMLAIALLRSLNGRKLPFAIEVVGFSEEEGVRFAVPFLGSLALMGHVEEELLSRQDANGVSVRIAIREFGLNPEELPEAVLSGDALGYLEFHIEQGPVLDSLNFPLGVVEAIAGQTRLEFTFIGHANHAGTTPMNLRYDAVAAAAEWVTAVERRARRTAGLVATVGMFQSRPGVGNVIAGEARLSLDVRHRSDQARNAAVGHLMRQAEEIAQRRGLRMRCNVQMEQRAVLMDSLLVNQAKEALAKSGCEPHVMVSGAGHDAMILAPKIPSAMIFLRTPGGVSHDPAETVQVEDVAKAIEAGVHLLDQLAGCDEFLRGLQRA
jgi:allantoate deiminase